MNTDKWIGECIGVFGGLLVVFFFCMHSEAAWQNLIERGGIILVILLVLSSMFRGGAKNLSDRKRSKVFRDEEDEL